MMTTLTVIHMIISILLVALVLIQFGKGAEAGLFTDTGSSSILPQKGNVMVKITSVVAFVFFGLSLALASARGRMAEKSIFDTHVPIQQQAEQQVENKE